MVAKSVQNVVLYEHLARKFPGDLPLNHTGVLYIPDAFAMLVLMAVLLYIRRFGHAKDATLWLVGLSFILLEDVAAGSYRSGPAMHALTHAVALSSYVLAGFAFASAGRPPGASSRQYLVFSLAWVLPLLMICIMYGGDFHRIGIFEALVGAGCLAQGVCFAWFWKRSRVLAYGAALEMLAWGPMLWFAHSGGFREVTYWGLGCLYFAIALLLTRMVHRSRVGGAVVILGFGVWAACLFSHPYITPKTIAASFIDEVWTLQKFFVTIGLLLVMLDEERRHNLTLALYDPLTNLPNRRLLNDRLEQAVQLATRAGTSFALFLIDLNGFKAVNDEMGHEQGDRILQIAAKRLFGAVRTSDTLARWGGDEFAVVANGVRDRTACEAMCDVLAGALYVESGEPVPISGSVGYALFPDDGKELHELMHLADMRMYDGKRLFREQVALV